ncbi:hypothetical protein [Streptomyces sp. NPDC006333]|uniref:hypothetical protein n=1 Tax=Streptomyces sp. NPDC006333 TaxID=3156753 RepID=UPI0033BF1031
MTESHIEQAVAARIAAAKRRQEDMRRRRAELDAARRRGLAARHAAKLLNLRARESNAGMGQQPTTVGQTPTVARPATQTQPSRVDTATTERDSVSPSPVTDTATTADSNRGDMNTVDEDQL